MVRSSPLISIVLLSVLSFSMFGCGEGDDLVEEILIPDAELRSEIRWEVFRKASDEETPLTAEDMLKLTELDAEVGSWGRISGFFYDPPISDLTGLEYAENLVVLNLRRNDIGSVSPLEGLKNLRELNLSSNHVRDLTPLAGLENLRVLDLSGNVHYSKPLNVTPLTGLGNLRELNLGFNNIVDISPLARLGNLRELNLRRNDIVDISPLTELKHLQKLDLTDNPLSDDSKNLIIPIIEANGTEVLY